MSVNFAGVLVEVMLNARVRKLAIWSRGMGSWGQYLAGVCEHPKVISSSARRSTWLAHHMLGSMSVKRLLVMGCGFLPSRTLISHTAISQRVIWFVEQRLFGSHPVLVSTSLSVRFTTDPMWLGPALCRSLYCCAANARVTKLAICWRLVVVLGQYRSGVCEQPTVTPV